MSNAFIVAIYKLLVLQAALGLVLASYFFDRTPVTRRWFDRLLGVCALLAVAGFFNFGGFRMPNRGWVHEHEQWHFHLGSKYLEEIRYDGMYPAIIAANAELAKPAGRPRTVRDTLTFKQVPFAEARQKGEEVKARFSEARWAEFKGDLEELLKRASNLQGTVNDHGNTGSPSWAVLASALTRTMPLNVTSQRIWAAVDYVALAGLFVLVGLAFGRRALMLTMIVGMLAPKTFDWLGGSILRLDWLVAVGASMCLLKRDRPIAAGALMGYAVSSKAFAAFFAIPAGVWFVWDVLRRRGPWRQPALYVGASVAALVACVAASSLYFDGFAIWTDYAERIRATLLEKYYPNQHSFRDIFLQVAHTGPLSIFNPTPAPVAASLREVHINQYPISFAVARLVMVGLALWVALRHDVYFAFGMGVLLVFIGSVANLYYFIMVLLFALGTAPGYVQDFRRAAYLAGALVFLTGNYVFEHYGALKWHRGYFGAWMLFWLFMGMVAVEAVHAVRQRRRVRAERLARLRETERPAEPQPEAEPEPPPEPAPAEPDDEALPTEPEPAPA